MSIESIKEFLKSESPKSFSTSQIVYFLKGNLSESVIYANLKKIKEKIDKRLVEDYEYYWGTTLSSKSRPCKFFKYKGDRKWNIKKLFKK